jgi:hypothetical protein
MGQQVFIPNAGGAGGNNGSVFLTDLYSDGDYVDYGFALPGGGGDVFYSGEKFSAVLVFRVVQENLLSITIPLLTVVDSAATGWGFFINSLSEVCAQVDAQNLIPEVCNLPLGRVFVATLTHASAGETNLYLNGRFMVQTSAPQPAVTAPVSILIGGSGAWTKDFIEYIGFGFIDGKQLEDDEVSSVYIATQDAGKLVFPATTVVGETYVVYNAATGLSNTALWVPEINTISAPDLPAVPSGIAAGTLLTAPFHPAHSGWADVPIP